MLADIFGPDLLIVAIVLVVLLFGGAAIPKLARNLGSAKNQFEKGLQEGKADGTSADGTSANGTSANGTSANGTSANGTSAAADAPAPTSSTSSTEEKTQGA